MFARLVDDAYEIRTIKPDGTGLKRLAFKHGNDAHMAWSPDSCEFRVVICYVHSQRFKKRDQLFALFLR
jgi:hypothetical protein